MLNKDTLNKIKKHALEDKTKECCGFILINNTFFPCKNESTTPNKNFLISNLDKQNAEKINKIKYFYHSHLDDSDFSLLDKVVAEKHNIICIKYNIPSDNFDFYYANGFSAPLIGREYCFGYFDCFSLIRDYYDKELNIKLTDFPTRENEHFQENLDNWINNNNFEYTNELQKYCLLGIKNMDNFFIHCAVYIGDNKIIHQPEYELSKIEHYSNKFKKRTICILKHKLL